MLRIEDTDRERSTKESIDAIIEGMEWLELDYDEGPFFQTDRFDRYRDKIAQLLDSGLAYRCYCSTEELEAMRNEQRAAGLKPRYDRRCRHRDDPSRPGVDPVIRFKNPEEGSVVFDDFVRGRVSIANDELDDLIIARADGTPTYNFTVVVDDIDMAITHVIRGDDHVNNTPRQINIFEALGAELPRFAHVPMILGADGQRLSKRHGALSVLEYRNQGYLPVALRNYLVRLGWSYGDQEIFTTAEMIEKFDIEDVNRGASSFDPDKLLWLNQHYIKEANASDLEAQLRDILTNRGIDCADGPDVAGVVEVLRERSQTLQEMADKAEYFYRDFDQYEATAAKKHLRPVAEEPLRAARTGFNALADWTPESIYAVVTEVAESLDLKMGKLAQPLRVAVSGTAATPSIDQTVALVGRDRTLRRIDHALDYIAQRKDSQAP